MGNCMEALSAIEVTLCDSFNLLLSCSKSLLLLPPLPLLLLAATTKVVAAEESIILILLRFSCSRYRQSNV